MSFKSYFNETSAGDIASVDNKLDLVKRDKKNCPECGSDKIVTERRPDGDCICNECNHKFKNSINESTEIENLLRTNDIKIKNVIKTRFGTQIDLFRVPDDLKELLKSYDYELDGKSIFIKLK